MKKCKIILYLMLFLNTSNAYSENKIKIEGQAKVGFHSESYKRGQAIHEAKIKVSSKRKKGLKTVISFEGENDKESLSLLDVYIDQKDKEDESYSLRYGQTKKIMGLEYEYSSKKRLGISRSFVYQRLEEFGYVGREILVRYEKKYDSGWNYSLSGGYSASIDADIILHINKENFLSDFNTGIWLLIQSDRTDHNKQTVWATTWSTWLHSYNHQFEIELFNGIDPFETQVSETFASGRKILYAASKIQYGYKFETSNKSIHGPFMQLGSYHYDIKTPQYNSLIALVGWNFQPVKQLNLALNLEAVANNSILDLEERSYEQSSVKISAKYYF